MTPTQTRATTEHPESAQKHAANPTASTKPNATSGPVIHDFGMDGDCVYVSCSDCREIHFVTYAPRGKSFFAGAGKPLTAASYRLTGKESYVRVVCVDENGHSAWSNPIFFDGRT